MEYCSTEGIKKEHTVLHTPQQNGVAERKNRTMVGAAKAMLFDQGLPLFLWAEAYRTTVYIQNRCPHIALGRKTLEEVFKGTRPDVSNIRIFDSVSIVMFMLTIGRSWTLLERRGCLLGTMRYQRHIEFTFLLAEGSL